MLDAAINAILYAATLLIMGTAAAYWLVVPRSVAQGGQPESSWVERRLGRLGRLASCAAILALGLRAWSQTAAAFGLSASLSWDSLAVIMFQSSWGRNWQLQLLAATACAVVFSLPQRKAVWMLATFTGLLLSLSEARTGHAAGSSLRSAVQAAHLIGGGAWLGTLAVLALAGRSAPLALQQTLFRKFSLLAMAGASLLVVSGLLASFFYLGSWPKLWTSVYGRVLLLKIVCFGGVLACGFANWKQVRNGAPALSRTIRLELGFAMAVIAITGLLTGVPHP